MMEFLKEVKRARLQGAADALDEVWYTIHETFYKWETELDEDTGKHKDFELHYAGDGFIQIYEYLRDLFGYDVYNEDIGGIGKPSRHFKLSTYTPEGAGEG